ncbi:MAG: cell wall-binding repeat-containing protein [Ornithinimicrobium sp.]
MSHSLLGSRSRASAVIAAAALVAPLGLTQTASAQVADNDAEPGTYIVQFVDLPIASYEGDIKGMASTKPGAGERIDTLSAEAQEYGDFLADQQVEAVEAVGASESDILHSYDTALNGVAVDLTGAEAAAMAKSPDVVNIWESEVRTADTVTTPDYLGMSGEGGVWDEQFGGADGAGEGMIVGIIDTGIWPENESFAEMPGATVPADWNGECVVGDDADAANNIECNNKLIGARYYNEDVDVLDIEFESPRDYDGHGTHTGGTAAGNNGVPMTVNGIDLGEGSGMAPKAHVATYKALWADGEGSGSGSTADLVAAIDDAVADGVDVINYSVSGSRQYVVTPDELAFLGAADAGVFVSASAGNSGDTVGSSSVAHNSPWTMTVAASTHNRNVNKALALGDGTTYQGVGVGPGVGETDLVLGADIPASGATPTEAAECILDIDGDTDGDQIAIDAAEADGKIVICDRGSIARVDKSAAVAEAGGVGMVHTNTDPAQSLNADFHSVPTVHVDSTIGNAIKAYEATADAPTASIGEPQSGAVVAPEMAGFSSYGPAQAGSGDLLKPDITAPGVDVIAAVAPPGWGGEDFESLSGTSMSAPHIAGLAALMMQANPDWSPAAVKSSMMTTARTSNSDDGQIQRTGGDATPLDYGSGEVVPGSAYSPGLVYDAGYIDWITYACSINQYQLVLADPTLCDPFVGNPSDLNYPTISIGDLGGSETITRTVTNVGDTEATYSSASSVAPPGVGMTVTPASITVPAGGDATFEVTFTQVDAPLDTYTFGSLVWEPVASGSGTAVTSQVAIQPTAVATLDEIVDTGASGSRDYDLVSGFGGTLETDIDGLVPAEVVEVAAVNNPDSLFDGTGTFDVPADTKFLRFAIYDDEVPASDADLYLLDPDGAGYPTNLNGTSTEEVTISNPDPGEWTVVIDLFSAEPSATVPVNGFFVDETDAGNLTVSPTSAAVQPADEVAMTAEWSDLEADTRYLGAINYSSGSDVVGRTLVNISVDADGSTNEVGRIGGTNRYETAALIAAAYPEPEAIETVYIANGSAFADALSGASPAANANVPTTMEKIGGVPAPVLLTKQGSLPEPTKDALSSIDPTQIILLGGPGAVAESVEDELEDYGDVERIGGDNRYGTSALVALLSGTDVPVVYLASGTDANFPDALSGGALAGSQNAPVLLTRPDRVDPVTAAALEALNPEEIVVLGGEGAVSKVVYDAVGADRRLAGSNRYKTAVKVSEEFDAEIEGTYVASGEAWPDALAGSALSGFLGQPITLSKTADVPDEVMTELDRLSPNQVALLGGPNALTEDVADELNGSYGAWRE